MSQTVVRTNWWVLLLLCLAQFMVILHVTVVNVALPVIAAELDLDRAAQTWSVTAYTLCFGGLMLLGGRLADAISRRGVFLVGLAVFTLASLASGLAEGATTLVAARAVQGIGGGHRQSGCGECGGNAAFTATAIAAAVATVGATLLVPAGRPPATDGPVFAH